MTDFPGVTKPRQDEMQGVAEHVLTRIEEAAPFGVWSRTDFLDLAGSSAVEKALQRLLNRGHIRRPLRGFYDQPLRDRVTGKWQIPPVLSFVNAIARRDQMAFLVDGMTAAYALGLTHTRPFPTIIHAKTRPRLVRINASMDERAPGPFLYRLDFKRFSLGMSSFWAGQPSMLLVQAFHWLNDHGHDLNAAAQEVIPTLRAGEDRQAIATDLRSNMAMVEPWMQPFMHEVADALDQEAH